MGKTRGAEDRGDSDGRLAGTTRGAGGRGNGERRSGGERGWEDRAARRGTSGSSEDWDGEGIASALKRGARGLGMGRGAQLGHEGRERFRVGNTLPREATRGARGLPGGCEGRGRNEEAREERGRT